jgi:hypothetical protein
MRHRRVFLVFLLFFCFAVRASSSAAGSELRDTFIRERSRFFELPGAENVGAEERIKLKKAFSTTNDRMLAALLRLEDISGRLKSRSAKIGDGRDAVKQANIKIALADQGLIDAEHVREKASDDFEHLFLADSPAEALRSLHYDISENILVKLHEAHTALVEATLLLENINGEAK